MLNKIIRIPVKYTIILNLLNLLIYYVHQLSNVFRSQVILSEYQC